MELALTLTLYKHIGSELAIPGVCGLGVKFTLDGFRYIYAVIIAFMWATTTIFSREYLKGHRNRNRYYLYVLLTLGAIRFMAHDKTSVFNDDDDKGEES